MNRLVEDWVEKAEGDFHAAGRELRARKMPAYHVSCFLSQQCAEKYLKAFLQAHGREIPKVHKLVDLLILVRQVEPALEILRSDLEELERCAVRVRYPGTFADKDDAKAAYRVARIVRETPRRMLGLPNE